MTKFMRMSFIKIYKNMFPIATVVQWRSEIRHGAKHGRKSAHPVAAVKNVDTFMPKSFQNSVARRFSRKNSLERWVFKGKNSGTVSFEYNNIGHPISGNCCPAHVIVTSPISVINQLDGQDRP